VRKLKIRLKIETSAKHGKPDKNLNTTIEKQKTKKKEKVGEKN